jgi:L-amino acid N-acyltransferase YncA
MLAPNADACHRAFEPVWMVPVLTGLAAHRDPAMNEMTIRSAVADDAVAIARIYNHYVLNTTISFEDQAVPAAEMAGRMAEVESASLPWKVAVDAGRVVGYAYAGKWKGRCAYRHSAESSIYLDAGVQGRGIGRRLYQALLSDLRERSIHVAIGGIALPNPASIALHERLGFSQVAHFREVGFKFGRWLDVGYWQVTL